MSQTISTVATTSSAAALAERAALLPKFGGHVFSSGEDLAWTLSSIVFGAMLGLSQPEFGVWILAWVGLVPLFLLSVSSRRMSQAAARGFLFGASYNLMALNWFLHLNPPWWFKSEATEALQLLGIVVWLLAGLLQGSAFTLLSCLTKFVTDSNRFGHIKLMVALPFVWVFITHILYNQPDLLLMPMSVLEYSQYQQTWIIQIASVIGGIGLELLIVSINVALAAVVVATAGRRGIFPAAAFVSRKWSLTLLSATWVVVLAATIWGWWRLESRNHADVHAAQTNVSVVQGNFTRIYKIEKRKRALAATEIWNYCRDEVRKCPDGVVIFTETLLPASALSRRALCNDLEETARASRCDLIVGAWEQAGQGQTYNAAFSVSPDEGLHRAGYRKRYLIPFGEFEPLVIRCLPAKLKEGWYTRRRPQILRGTTASGLPTRSGSVAAIICGESFDSFLCAGSVSRETSMTANLSNLTWFEGSSLGQLVAAVSVMRAVENERPFVYSCETGPSFIVDSYGRILNSSTWSRDAVVTAPIHVTSQVTPFTAFCQLFVK